MKKYLFVGLLVMLSLTTSVLSEEIPLDVQKEIMTNYMYVTGQLDKNQMAAFEDEELQIHKCGMPPVHQFKTNYNKFDKSLLKSLGVELYTRPVLPNTRTSPSGKFLIHFTAFGDSAVYSQVPGGAVGYVDSVGLILDEVYDYTINVLGYPEPPVDSFYSEGGDEKYDVYLYDLGGAFYGLAYADSILYNVDSTVITATSFLELDNDYFELLQYRDRPLDAVRVTVAHEFFHMVQFGIDVTESEVVSNAVEGPVWMEMSSVWMEEELYDDLNDYYNYLPFFFDEPWTSIQQFRSFSDLHPYASVVYPIFLSEKFDRDIIHTIWSKCGEYGPGPHFLEVVGEIVDSLSGGFETFETTFAEFALWNYFTGSRAELAPEGIGYSERFSYKPEFDDNIFEGNIRVHYTYPFVVPGNNNTAFNPDHNGAFYLSLINVDKLIPEYTCVDSSVVFDTTYWVCNDGTFPDCNDSSEVLPPTPYDTLYVDTFVCTDSIDVMKFILGLEPAFSNSWGTSIVYRYKNDPDSIDVDSMLLPEGAAVGIDIENPRLYSNITFIITPASSNRHFYAPPNAYDIGFGVLNDMIVDSSSINAPAIVFYPYPNPAVVDDMNQQKIKFKFKLPTDSLGQPVYLLDSVFNDFGVFTGVDLLEPYLVVDIFTVAGERVKTLLEISETDSAPNTGEYVMNWDMKNESGMDVASGVYLAYVRFYPSEKDNTLLGESKTKIAIIR